MASEVTPSSLCVFTCYLRRDIFYDPTALTVAVVICKQASTVRIQIVLAGWDCSATSGLVSRLGLIL